MTAQTFSPSWIKADRRTSVLQIALLFLTFVMVSIIPVVTQSLPPLEDYANHLARMHVIADHGRDPLLARFYEIDWEVIPDLMMDLIVPVLTRFVNVYAAGQIFVVSIFLLIMTGTFALNRALFGRWSALPLIAFPLLYNYVFLIGTLNYLFGVGLAIWALAAWITLRDHPWPLRYGISVLFAGALYLCHLYSVGLYGLALVAYEMRNAFGGPRRAWWRRALGFGLPFLPFLPLIPALLGSSTWRHAADFSWEPRGKIDGLIYVIEAYSDILAFFLAGIVAVGAAWAARNKALRVNSFAVFLLTVSAAVYLALPRILFSTYMADQRLPIAIAFMAVACVQVDFKEEAARRVFLLLSLVLLATRVIEVDATWAQKSSVSREMKESLRKIKRGSTILVAHADREAADDVGQVGLVHAACLAIIERASLVTTAFTVSGKQIMHATPAYRGSVDTEDGNPPSLDELVLDALGRSTEEGAYWSRWVDKYDYVYVLFTDDDMENPLPELLKPVFEGERFRLYKVTKKEKTAAQPAG